MSSVNKVILIGALGRDPESRQTQAGQTVVNLSVATSESWKDKASGERKDRTEWHRVTIWNENLAKIAEQYLRKGSKVYLEGSLQTRKWTDKQGIEKYTTEIVLAAYRGQITLLDAPGGKKDEEPAGSYGDRRNPDRAPTKSPRDLDDDIPF